MASALTASVLQIKREEHKENYCTPAFLLACHVIARRNITIVKNCDESDGNLVRLLLLSKCANCKPIKPGTNVW